MPGLERQLFSNVDNDNGQYLPDLGENERMANVRIANKNQNSFSVVRRRLVIPAGNPTNGSNLTAFKLLRQPAARNRNRVRFEK